MAISQQARIVPQKLAVVVRVTALVAIVVHVGVVTLALVLVAAVGIFLTKIVVLNGKVISIYPYI